MDSCKLLLSPSIARQFKIKVGLLGGTEIYKNIFQKSVSCKKLPIENKKCIGVNISKIELKHKSNNFELYLWNIDCNQNWVFLRSTFYHGAEALIVFISETKITQIRQYLTEIKLRIPIVQIFFCILLENHTKEEIIEAHLNNDQYKSLISSNNVKFCENIKPLEMFKQICLNYKKKIENKRAEDIFVFNFISLKDIINQNDVSDTCNNYFEPQDNNNINVLKNHRINVQLVKDYLSELNIQYDTIESDNILIENQKYGIFSIYLRNGKISYYPRICKICEKRKCEKYNDAPFFVCIEQKTIGWTNIRGLNQAEMLVISKIIAIKNNKFPKSVITQIKKINTCIKNKNNDSSIENL